MRRRWTAAAGALGLALLWGARVHGADTDGAPRERAGAALKKAAGFYRTKVASHGGYVYHYDLDLQRRWGEGEATRDQVWVQPPGTPAVGMAYLRAYEATGDRYYLDAAREAGGALVYGQLQSGAWANCIDFDPNGKKVGLYRNGKGRGKNNQSSLDDNQSQSAIRFLTRLDRALQFQDAPVQQAVQTALSALLKAQFPNGAFPQGWRVPVQAQPVLKASYPEYDWRTEGKVDNYWDMYTLNDGVAGNVADALKEALDTYKDPRYRAALVKLGDFLILAQMPDPQPAWAQQYGYTMKPIWARRFEPAAISGWESQDAIATLMKIYRVTGDGKYLDPIPRALAYLKRSRLPDGQMARYYELKTNRPLYMVRRAGVYSLTFDDKDLPSHYGWKRESLLDELEKEYNALKSGRPAAPAGSSAADQEKAVRQVLRDLDDQGRWISTYDGQRLVGQPDFKKGFRYIGSDVFIRNVETLSDYLAAGAR